MWAPSAQKYGMCAVKLFFTVKPSQYYFMFAAHRRLESKPNNAGLILQQQTGLLLPRGSELQTNSTFISQVQTGETVYQCFRLHHKVDIKLQQFRSSVINGDINRVNFASVPHDELSGLYYLCTLYASYLLSHYRRFHRTHGRCQGYAPGSKLTSGLCLL